MTSRSALPSFRHADLHVVTAAPLSLRLRGLALWRCTLLALGLLWLLREERNRRQRQQHRGYTQHETMWSHLAIS